MRDLDALLAADLDAREQRLGSAVPVDVLTGVMGRVRRNRNRRHAVQGVAAIVAVAVFGTAGWWGLLRDEPQPAQTPAPTVSSSPSAGPTPTVTPAPGLAPEPVMVELPGLPPMPQATPELIASAPPGWALVTYRLSEYVQEPGPAVTHAILLVSPSGERYHVIDLPLDEQTHLERWRAGTTVVDGQSWGDADQSIWVRIDLLTGAVTAATAPEQPAETSELERDFGWSWDGRRVVAYYHAPGSEGYWYGETQVYLRDFDGTQTRVQSVTWLNQGLQSPILDPTGTRLLFWSSRVPPTFAYPLAADDPRLVQASHVLDLQTGVVTTHVVAQPDTCDLVNWFADATVLGLCGTDLADAEHRYADGLPDADFVAYRFDVLGTADPVSLGPFSDDFVTWPGAGVIVPEGIWLDREDSGNPLLATHPWLVPTTPGGEPRSLPWWPDTGYARVIAGIDGLLYAIAATWELPAQEAVAVGTDGSVTELLDGWKASEGELIATVNIVVGR